MMTKRSGNKKKQPSSAVEISKTSVSPVLLRERAPSLSKLTGDDVVAIASQAASVAKSSEKQKTKDLPKLSVTPVGSLASQSATEQLEYVKDETTVIAEAVKSFGPLLTDLLKAMNRIEEQNASLNATLMRHISNSEREWDALSSAIAAINLRPRSVEAVKETEELIMESSGNDGDDSEEEEEGRVYYEPTGVLSPGQLSKIAESDTEVVEATAEEFKVSLYSQTIEPSPRLAAAMQKKAASSKGKEKALSMPGGETEELDW